MRRVINGTASSRQRTTKPAVPPAAGGAEGAGPSPDPPPGAQSQAGVPKGGRRGDRVCRGPRPQLCQLGPSPSGRADRGPWMPARRTAREGGGRTGGGRGLTSGHGCRSLREQRGQARQGHFLGLSGHCPRGAAPDLCPCCGLGRAWARERLPAEGQQTREADRRGELLHALLDDDAVDGPADVVGEEGLSCRETGRQGCLQPGSRCPSPEAPGAHVFSPWGRGGPHCQTPRASQGRGTRAVWLGSVLTVALVTAARPRATEPGGSGGTRSSCAAQGPPALQLSS